MRRAPVWREKLSGTRSVELFILRRAWAASFSRVEKRCSVRFQDRHVLSILFLNPPKDIAKEIQRVPGYFLINFVHTALANFNLSLPGITEVGAVLSGAVLSQALFRI